MRQMSLFPAPRQVEFKRLTHDICSWTGETLGRCSSLQLQALAALLHVSKSGNKQTLVARLLATKDLRIKLSKIEKIEELVEAYKLKDLKGMCATAKVFRSGNKRQSAAVLLSWRNRCRYEGQKFLLSLEKKDIA